MDMWFCIILPAVLISKYFTGDWIGIAFLLFTAAFLYPFRILAKMLYTSNRDSIETQRKVTQELDRRGRTFYARLDEPLFRELVKNNIVKVPTLDEHTVEIYLSPMEWNRMYQAIDDARKAEQP